MVGHRSNSPGPTATLKTASHTWKASKKLQHLPRRRKYAEHKNFWACFFTHRDSKLVAHYPAAKETGERCLSLVIGKHHAPNVKYEWSHRLVAIANLADSIQTTVNNGDDDETSRSINPYQLFLISRTEPKTFRAQESILQPILYAINHITWLIQSKVWCTAQRSTTSLRKKLVSDRKFNSIPRPKRTYAQASLKSKPYNFGCEPSTNRVYSRAPSTLAVPC